MIYGQDRELGHATCLVEADIDCQLVAGLFAGAHEAGVADLSRQFDL